MASAAGSAQGVNESRAQALQALLHSISPGDATDPGQKLTSERVRKISDKLGELFGDGQLGTDGVAQKCNDKGELLNEEGLPIVDIVEPVSNGASESASVPVFEDPDILPLWALSPAEKARRRAERERILDVLEEEEHVEEERADAAAEERRKVELEKRKEAAKAELEALKKAKELQKKMGKALLRNVIQAKEREEKENARQAQEDSEKQKEGKQRVKPKKNVSFAELPEDSENKEDKWGDVSLARLQNKGKSSLLTRTEMDKQPMKMEVVERHPAGFRRSPPPGIPPSAVGDSDDESDPGSPVPADSDEGEIIHSDRDSEDGAKPPPSLPDTNEDNSDDGLMTDDGESVEWKDDDFDFVRHQREVALAYYEKRATIGAEAVGAIRAHTHEEGENEWDQPEVPLEATLASAPPKPANSRFKTERISSSLASHSLGSSVLPSSQSSSLKNAVRMGKLENDKLVGGDSDEDDIEAEAKAIIELLSLGEVKNVGPQLSSSTVAPNAGVSVPVVLPPTTDPATAVSEPKPRSSKVSKFKLSLAQASKSQPAGPSSPPLTTPNSTAERSSPKLHSPGPRTSISVPSRTRPQNPAQSPALPDSSTVVPQRLPAQMPDMVVEPPSFPRSALVSPTSSANSSIASTPTVVGSPQLGNVPIDPVSFQSVIIDSPSFQNPAVVGIPSFSLPATAGAEAPMQASVSERSPAMMAAEVRESKSTARRGGASGDKEKKVSRFMAGRM